jgi:hypothetical protein
MKIASIKSGVRICGELFADWNVFLDHLRGYLSDGKETVIDAETVQYDYSSGMHYEMSVIGHKRIRLNIQNHILDIDYIVEFQKIGKMAEFTFVGLEQDFHARMMIADLSVIFDTFTMSKHVVREHIEFVTYD